jgi:hypothetical protein
MDARTKDYIFRTISSLDLNLQNKVVLTEAATGPYMVTPIIAAIAGAKVYAFAKDSKYGTADEVIQNFTTVLKDFDGLQIEFIKELSQKVLSEVDIITNSGNLRPIDSSILQHTKKDVVISLMYEKWEFRNTDLDLEFCKKKSIKVGAVNERHPDVGVFEYLGEMSIKLIHDAGITITNNTFLLICNNDFGPYIANTLSELCQSIGVIDLAVNKEKYSNEVEWLSNFPKISVPEKYKIADAIIFTASPFNKKWIGNGLEIQIDDIKQKVNNPVILRFAGDINTDDCDKKGLQYYPTNVKSGHMGVLPSDIGFDSIIRLQTGGLKVGELLFKNQESVNNIPLLQQL